MTDLDGTLLDHDTYTFAPAEPALTEIRRLAIPLAILTSKTRAEVAPLRRAIDIDGPDIVENGAWSRSYSWICEQLQSAAEESGTKVAGFSTLPPEVIAERTGLPVHAAQLSAQREFAESFIVTGGDPVMLTQAIERRGLRWTRGGRFHHIFESGGKETALRKLLEDDPGATTLGLGDALNDLEMLRLVDRAVIVNSPRAEALHRELPSAIVTQRPGPAGWNDAVLAFLAQHHPSACRP